LTPTELILIKYIEQQGWEVSKTLSFDEHQYWTAEHKRESKRVRADTIQNLFLLWSEHPLVLAKVLGVNLNEVTEEQARKEQEDAGHQ
jgi:hypothetical protein